MTQQEQDMVLSLYKDGWNPEDIAEELGLDEMEVIDFCAENL